MGDVLENGCESPGTRRHWRVSSKALVVTLDDLNVRKSFKETG